MERKSNHVEEYFKEQESQTGRLSRELFSVGKEGDELDFKTDLVLNEIKDISSLFYNDAVLVRMGLYPVYEPFYQKYMRLVISKDRKSRGEFVAINKADQSDDMIGKLSNLDSLRGSKQ